MEENLKLLEWVIVNQLYIDTHNECDYHNIHQAIENLIKGYKDLEEKLDTVKEIYYTQKEIETDYILKSKVREIIDKYLKNTKLNPNGYCLSFEGSQKVAKEILKLLQEGDK